MERIELTMERMEVLVAWWVKHEYFVGQVCRCVELFPDKCTLNLLKRRNVKFKRLGINNWALLGNINTEWEMNDEIVVEVKLKDPFFAYYTESQLPDKLLWRPGMQNNIEVNGEAKSLKWEYVILMKDWKEGCELELREAEGRLKFENKGRIRMNEMEGYRMESTIAVKLQERYNYNIRLSEKKVLGYKVICKRLPWPEPGSFPECGDGCIRKVMVI